MSFLGGDVHAAAILELREQDVYVAANVDGKIREIRAEIDIHAPPEQVWHVLTSCDQAVRFIPGLVDCHVVKKAADESWEDVHHDLHYSWFLPHLSYEFRARLDRPRRIDFLRLSGDLKSLAGGWSLHKQGAVTHVTYEARAEPGFWVPQWLLRLAVKREMPAMMRQLRDLAEHSGA